jgi:hypothetical protein
MMVMMVTMDRECERRIVWGINGRGRRKGILRGKEDQSKL